jgi:predicted nucleic acid-binding protein
MEKKILVDTDIIIKSFRGNSAIYKELLLIKNKFAISVVTALELLNGANNIKQLASTKKELKAYTIVHFNNNISQLSLQLLSKYSLSKKPQLPDLFIAATALHYNLSLYTDNKKHYNFIEGLEFYKEK